MLGRADDAYTRGDYLQAAELYDRVVTADPNDADANARRTGARNGALRQLLGDAQSARAAGRTEDANTRLGQMLDKRDAWKMTVEPAIAPAFATEIAAASASIKANVLQQVQVEGPLRAEIVLHHYDTLTAHAELRALHDELGIAVVAAGRASCDKLAEDALPASPYWSWAVNRYCQHWGGHLKFDPQPPHLRSTLAVSGDIGGAGADESARLRASLAAAFTKTLWYGPDARDVAHATLEGQVAATFTQRRVGFDKPWTETIPYTDYETYQEPYQEPYTATETYSEQVPYTDNESYSYPCGRTTCSGSRAVTKYRSETRTRTVTRYRTAYRTQTRAVTRYRYEPRSFHYDAEEVTGHYASSIVVRIDRGASPAFVVKIDDATSTSGVFHDVSFAAAGVAPERATLPTREGFFSQEEVRLDAQLAAALDARYREIYCAAPRYSIDEAAACAYAGAKNAPAGVHTALRERFGDDEELVAALLVR